MSTVPGAPSGPPLGDDELGRLLSEGLRRSADRPVDGHALMQGAQRGAARIRHRRQVAAALATVVIVGVPAGVYTGRWLGSGGRVSSASAASSSAAEGVGAAGGSAAGSASSSGAPVMAAAGTGSVRAGSDAAAASPSAATGMPTLSASAPASSVVAPTVYATRSSAISASPGARPAPLERTASGTVMIPSEPLLTAADAAPVIPAGFTSSSDTGNRTVPPPPAAADVCGASLSGLPAEAGGRAVTFQRGQGTASGWLFASTVRVFAGSGATRYLGTIEKQGCLRQATTGTPGPAAEGHGTVDALGRTHWFAVAGVGRTVTEVRLVTPKGAAITDADVTALLTVAARRLTTSGLAGSAAADPALS